jgi:hypothetical protein
MNLTWGIPFIQSIKFARAELNRLRQHHAPSYTLTAYS